MIVIEGPDFVGKTTLAQALVKRAVNTTTPLTYRHLTRLHPSFHPYWGYVPMFDRDAVLDRFYHSRQAYGRVFGNQAVNQPDVIRLLDAKLALHAGVTVVVTASESWIKARREAFAKTDQMYDFDGVLKVNTAYFQMVMGRECAVDFHIHLENPECWPSSFVESIWQAHDYRHRLVEDLAASNRRPPCL